MVALFLPFHRHGDTVAVMDATCQQRAGIATTPSDEHHAGALASFYWRRGSAVGSSYL